MPNQCGQAVVKERWGWFLGDIVWQKSPNLWSPIYSTTVLYDTVQVLCQVYADPISFVPITNTQRVTILQLYFICHTVQQEQHDKNLCINSSQITKTKALHYIVFVIGTRLVLSQIRSTWYMHSGERNHALRYNYDVCFVAAAVGGKACLRPKWH